MRKVVDNLDNVTIPSVRNMINLIVHATKNSESYRGVVIYDNRTKQTYAGAVEYTGEVSSSILDMAIIDYLDENGTTKSGSNDCVPDAFLARAIVPHMGPIPAMYLVISDTGFVTGYPLVVETELTETA